jgi:hypothetical protein
MPKLPSYELYAETPHKLPLIDNLDVEFIADVRNLDLLSTRSCASFSCHDNATDGLRVSN